MCIFCQVILLDLLPAQSVRGSIYHSYLSSFHLQSPFRWRYFPYRIDMRARIFDNLNLKNIQITDPDYKYGLQIRITDPDNMSGLQIQITDPDYRSGLEIWNTDPDYRSG